MRLGIARPAGPLLAVPTVQGEQPLGNRDFIPLAFCSVHAPGRARRGPQKFSQQATLENSSQRDDAIESA